VIFGGVAVANASQDESNRVLDLLFAHGINHIDTAPSYGDSELRIGPWMRRHRRQFFLATKTQKRTGPEAREEIHRSLERLQTDHLDLLQLHFLVDPAEWEVAMGSGGALEAAVEAREQGLVRHIGVTGHGLTVAAMHLRSLARFDFASVLLPYNFLMDSDAVYHAGFESVAAICREREIACQTIKGVLRGPWGDAPKTRNTWYRPLESAGDIALAVHWVLGHPGIFMVTAGDPDLLPVAIEAAESFERRPEASEMVELRARTGMAPLFTS
jgi:aryl-alcohol dehydrogenase-like predicted oxidoreductase